MRKVRLGDHLRFTRGTSLSGDYYATCGDYVRLTLGNFDFKENRFKENTAKSDIYFTGSFKPIYLLSAGDVITPLTEQTRGLLGSTARIPDSDRYILSQDIAKIESLDRDILLSYAYYLFPSTVVRKQLDAGSQQTKIRHTSVSKLEDLIAFVPPIEEQKRIVSFLSRLDSLIERYDKQIQELEQTAQDIYDYWFVQYDFPDENGNPYRSSGGKMTWNNELNREIPVGWSTHSLYSIAEFTNGLACQRHRPYADDAGLPVIKIKEMTEGISAKTERVSSAIPPKYFVSLGDILFSWSATLLVQRWDSVDAGLNQHIFTVKPAPEVGEGYLYLLLQHVVGEFVAIAMARKTTMGHITQDHLRAKQVVLPVDKVRDSFEKLYQPLLEQWKTLKLQRAELVTLRNELLPLLLNGQASFPSQNQIPS